MNFTLTSPNTFTPSLNNSHSFTFLPFPLNHHRNNHRNRRHFRRRLTVNSHVPPTHQNKVQSSSSSSNVNSNVIKQLTKPIIFTVISLALALSPSLGLHQTLALAATATVETSETETKPVSKWRQLLTRTKKKEPSVKGHAFSDYTKSLLNVVGTLVKAIEEVRLRNADVRNVELALKEVKVKKQELQDEVMTRLYGELSELREVKSELDRKSGDVLASLAKVRKERDKVLERGAEKKGKGKDERSVVKELDEVIGSKEKEFMAIEEEIGEIEDKMEVKETMALSIGVRELCFIERECVTLVEDFYREMKRKGFERVPKSSLTKLSRTELKKDLQTAQKQFWEQTILPNVVESDDIVLPFDQKSVEFSRRIKQTLAESREMQKNLEDNIRRRMRRFGEEKQVILNSRVDDILKGYPEVEKKWTFGDKEVVVPKAARSSLFHGWKMWRDEAKKDLKTKLLEDVELGKQYVAERQERILLDRDRVLSKTWFNEDRNMWEMEPIAVPYAVSRKLLENARIRHDWAAMYITMKGDDKEYYVDLKEFDMLFEDFGGVDGLYLKMLASDVPTFVQLMWIPFSELDIRQQFMVPLRLARQLLVGLWNSRDVSTVDGIVNWVKNINKDIMVIIISPVLEFVIPSKVKMKLNRTVVMKQYLNWKSQAEEDIRSQREDEEFNWYFMFAVRSIIYVYVLSKIFEYLKRRTPKLPGVKRPGRRNPNMRKLRKLKYFFWKRLQGARAKKKEGVDPITHAFDQMKRVKNPPIRLKDFASVEFMREEINEVVAFLQNPRAFQDMGARAPRRLRFQLLR